MANNLAKLLEHHDAAYGKNLFEKQPYIGPYQKLPPTFSEPRLLDRWKAEFEDYCGSECEQCNKQFRNLQQQTLDSRMYADQLSTENVHAMAASFTRNIMQTRKFLQDKVATHGDVILARWKKKTLTERRQFVQEVTPNLYREKAPQVYVKEHCVGWAPKRKYRTALLLPYLTVDNLCDEKLKFPSLLHFRVSYEPQDWVLFDSDQFQSAFQDGSLELRFHESSVVLHGKNYGAVVDWNQNDAHAWTSVGWPRAHLILEAQSKLMRFLQNMVDKLLGSHSDEGGCRKWRALVEEGFRAPGAHETWSAYARPAFSAPPTFDSVSLLETAKDRLATLEDELELLQIDPAYTIHQIDHLQKLDFFRPKGVDTGERLTYIGGESAGTALKRVYCWRWVTEELSYICKIEEQHAESIKQGQLPAEYTVLIGSFQTLLYNLQSAQRTKLTEIVAGLEYFQVLFESIRSRSRGFKSDEEAAAECFPGGAFKAEPLLWAVLQLTTKDWRDRVDNNPSFVLRQVDEWLSHLTQLSTTRLDKRTVEYLEDLVALDSMLSSVCLGRPFTPLIKTEQAVETQGDRHDGPETWKNCTKCATEISPSAMEKVAATIESFVGQGWPKGRKDVEWLAKADQSRSKLQAFWAAVGEVVVEGAVAAGRTPTDIKYLRSLTQFHTSPTHMAELEAERKSIIETQDIKPVPIVQQHNLWSRAETGSVKSEVTRNARDLIRCIENKRNAHRQDPPNHASTQLEARRIEDVAHSDGPGSTHKAIELDRPSLRIFRTMFCTDPDTRTKVRWPQLVEAMTKAGLFATEASGSAVKFKHNELGSITFHRPHTDVVEPIMLSKMTWRLRGWFGWNESTFVERNKDLK